MNTIIDFLLFLLNMYVLVLIVRSLLSFFPNIDYRNPFVRFLYDITEPVLAPVRRAVPPMGGMDWSVLIVLVTINILSLILRRL